jgi:hypothetical protein
MKGPFKSKDKENEETADQFNKLYYFILLKELEEKEKTGYQHNYVRKVLIKKLRFELYKEPHE